MAKLNVILMLLAFIVVAMIEFRPAMAKAFENGVARPGKTSLAHGRAVPMPTPRRVATKKSGVKTTGNWRAELPENMEEVGIIKKRRSETPHTSNGPKSTTAQPKKYIGETEKNRRSRKRSRTETVDQNESRSKPRRARRP